MNLPPLVMTPDRYHLALSAVVLALLVGLWIPADVLRAVGSLFLLLLAGVILFSERIMLFIGRRAIVSGAAYEDGGMALPPSMPRRAK